MKRTAAINYIKAHTPPVLSALEETHGLRFTITQFIWPEIQKVKPSSINAIHNLYGAMSLAGAMNLWDLFDDLKVLIDVAWSLQGRP